jgi:hypothetical protein
MPYNNYNSIVYSRGYTKVKYETLTINNNIWLNNISNIWCSNYRYTLSEQRSIFLDNSTQKIDIFLKELEPCTIAEKYKMRNFVFNNKNNNKTEYSQGTIWIGSGEWGDGSQNFKRGKVDLQTAIRSICREEIEYALWNYTAKLIENNNDNKLIEKLRPENIDFFKLKWFHNSKYPLKEMSPNGFRNGTDDSEFKKIKNINMRNKIFLN